MVSARIELGRYSDETQYYLLTNDFYVMIIKLATGMFGALMDDNVDELLIGSVFGEGRVSIKIHPQPKAQTMRGALD